jgi:hypothetical protein
VAVQPPRHEQPAESDRERDERGGPAEEDRGPRAERVGHPAHDRRSDRGPAHEDRHVQGEHAAAERRIGRRLHVPFAVVIVVTTAKPVNMRVTAYSA